MSEDLALAFDLYSIMTSKLHLYQDWLEVENILLWRDEIDDALQAGMSLTDEQMATLRKADDLLLAQRDRLVREFPQAFENTEHISARQWWWHLDKGPQVREEAERAA
ncbi:MAG: hypothetical protein ACM3US_02455 [Sphingomonadaceae bacterium]